MLKKIITDWSLWVLVVFNLYLLDYYYENPSEMATVIFLYWAQSVLIGVVNFFDLLTVPNNKENILPVKLKPDKDNISNKGCIASFFLLHYSGFHIGYLVFIHLKVLGKIDFNFVKIGLAILACSLVIDFIRNKIIQQHQPVNIGKMFMIPYARIIPMHLMILLPEFIGVSNFTVFIILKIVMDLLMHFALSGHYRSGGKAAALSSEL